MSKVLMHEQLYQKSWSLQIYNVHRWDICMYCMFNLVMQPSWRFFCLFSHGQSWFCFVFKSGIAFSFEPKENDHCVSVLNTSASTISISIWKCLFQDELHISCASVWSDCLLRGSVIEVISLQFVDSEALQAAGPWDWMSDPVYHLYYRPNLAPVVEATQGKSLGLSQRGWLIIFHTSSGPLRSEMRPQGREYM